MYNIRWAYHVTNVNKSQAQPTWETIECHPASHYNGILRDTNCAFFSTTLYNGALPTMSPFPLDGDAGCEYWRVKVPINYFDDHKVWFIESSARRALLVMTRGPEEESLMSSLQEKYPRPYYEVTNDEQVVKRYLEREGPDGSKKYKSNDYSLSEKKFVHIAVLHGVPVTAECKWDHVERMEFENQLYASLRRDGSCIQLMIVFADQ